MRTHRATKAATVRARIEPDVKERAERILNSMGISATQAVNMLYKKVIKDRGWPCELREFNDETVADLEASARGEGLVHFSSAEAMIADLHKAAKEDGIEIDDEE
ncbi:MAG: type II toxin-antitoxin system RelB/DinJ family antitoxin [Gammaproteobacteria bacterium]